MLWNELEEFYPKENFIPYVAGVTQNWTERLNERVSSDQYEDWTEVFLEKIKSRRQVNLRLESIKGLLPTTNLEQRKEGFVLGIPKSSPASQTQIASRLFEDFEVFFQEPGVALHTKTDGDDEWDEVVTEKVSAGPAVQASLLPKVEVLPRFDSLPRPEELFRTIIPYVLILRAYSGSVVIRGTHQPSLELISDYFSRHAKTDQNDTRKVPLVKVELKASQFGMGVSYDSLHIEPLNERKTWVEINEALFMSFIQGILGYELVSSEGSIYVYKRDTPYR
jgi:hypothetical protein